MRPQAIIFDLDFTLITFNEDDATEAAADVLRTARSGSDSQDTAKKDVECAIDQGLGSDSFRRKDWFFKCCHVDDDTAGAMEEAYWKAAEDSTELVPEALDVARELKKLNVRMAVLTDSDGDGYDKSKRVNAALAPLTEERLISNDDIFICGAKRISTLKTNLETYRSVCEKLHVQPFFCIMVGDKVESDIIPARKAGLATKLVCSRRTRLPKGFPVAVIQRLSELTPPGDAKAMDDEVDLNLHVERYRHTLDLFRDKLGKFGVLTGLLLTAYGFSGESAKYLRCSIAVLGILISPLYCATLFRTFQYHYFHRYALSVICDQLSNAKRILTAYSFRFHSSYSSRFHSSCWALPAFPRSSFYLELAIPIVVTVFWLVILMWGAIRGEANVGAPVS